MGRKNLKVPESLFLALRDDKPNQMSWPAYLERECLTGTDDMEHIKNQLDAIESSVSTAEERTGRIERTLEDMGAGR